MNGNITLARGCLNDVGSELNLNRRVLLLTDDGVPSVYAEPIRRAAAHLTEIRLPSGEQNKCLGTYAEIIAEMAKNHLDRHDCVLALGGGVIGDLAGFVAATYMRGIDFYNIPTTLLAQVDSSVGGKVAVDFDSHKNLVGCFYQPCAVLIDPDLLKTLAPRQFGCGMAEAIKMFATSDAEAFEALEQTQALTANPTNIPDAVVDFVIKRALAVKTDVVRRDEKESGLRRVLNFGHTVGHGIESLSGKTDMPLFHGEAVAVGMLCVTHGEVRNRLRRLLARFDLPATYSGSAEQLSKLISLDKKSDGETVCVITVDKIGSYRTENLTVPEIISQAQEVLTLT